MSAKFFNKLNKGTTTLFNKAAGETKMLGRGGRAFGGQLGGLLGSVGGEVKKAASDIEKATAGTPISSIAGKVGSAADLTQRSGRALKSISKGDNKGAVAQVKGVVKDIKGLIQV